MSSTSPFFESYSYKGDSCLRPACACRGGCRCAGRRSRGSAARSAFSCLCAEERGRPRQGCRTRCIARRCAGLLLPGGRRKVQPRRRLAPLKVARSSASMRLTSKRPARPLALPSSQRLRSTATSRSSRCRRDCHRRRASRMTSLVEAYSPSATAWRTELAIGAGKATLNRSISAICDLQRDDIVPWGVSKVLNVKQAGSGGGPK
jgi:hypothetical protein